MSSKLFKPPPVKVSTQYQKQNYSAGYAVKREVVVVKNYDHVIPSGRDHGLGAKRLMLSYVEDVMGKKPDVIKNDIAEGPVLPIHSVVDENAETWAAKVAEVDKSTIPLLSQISRQEALIPKHSTKEKKVVVDIATRLKKNDSTLSRIRLNFCNIDDLMCRQIANAMCNNTVLECLMLENNAITDQGLLHLSVGLRLHPTAHSLLVGANKITDAGVEHMCRVLLWKNPYMKEIGLSNRWPSEVWATKFEVDLHPRITHIGAKYLADSFRREINLTVLSLEDQRLGDEGARLLFEVLHHSKLLSLNLGGNGIGPMSCGALQKALVNPATKLEKLTLSNNLIDDDGADDIAEGLLHNTKLLYLDLTGNRLTSASLNSLFLCLSKNKTITSLFTTSNLDSDDRAEMLARSRLPGKGSLSKNKDSKNSSSASSLKQQLQHPLPPDNEFTGQDTVSATKPGSPSKKLNRAKSLRFAEDDGTDPLELHIAVNGNDNDDIARNKKGDNTSIDDRFSDGEANCNNSNNQQQAARLSSSSSSLMSKDKEEKTGIRKSPVQSPKNVSSELGLCLMRSSSKKKLTTEEKDKLEFERGNTETRQRFKRRDEVDEGPKDRYTIVNEGPDIRKSKDIGKTRGIPALPVGVQGGTLPMRVALGPHGDSEQHFMNLRIKTAADTEEDAPTSILFIGADRRREIEKVKKYRQSAAYKEHKALALLMKVKKDTSLAAMPKAPKYFWDDWKRKVRLQYYEGIDRSIGCTSTTIPTITRGYSVQEGMQTYATGASANSPTLPAIKVADSRGRRARGVGEGVSAGAGGDTMSVVASSDSSAIDSPVRDPLSFKKYLRDARTATPGEILAARRVEADAMRWADDDDDNN